MTSLDPFAEFICGGGVLEVDLTQQRGPRQITLTEVECERGKGVSLPLCKIDFDKDLDPVPRLVQIDSQKFLCAIGRNRFGITIGAQVAESYSTLTYSIIVTLEP